MMAISRRNLLRSSALVIAGTGLAACTVATSGTTTTITLDTARVKAYGQSGINAVATILSITAISTAMGTPAVAAIETAGAALSAALAEFSSATHGALKITYDNTSWKTKVDSVLVDLNGVATALRAGLTGAQQTVTSSVINTAITVFNALLTVLDAFLGVLGIDLSSVTPDAEAAALKTLAVQ